MESHTSATPNRRQFIRSVVAATSTAAVWPLTDAAATTPAIKTTQPEPEGFFTLGKRNDRWWLITPDGKPFFSIGLNHIDSASMRYPENIELWRRKYGGSDLRWIKESVAPNIESWGFNTVGWVQEVSVKQWRHSRSFTPEEYRALNMPYCHMLPFTQSHQWEKHTVHFDFMSDDWEQWCDYVARSHCAALKDDSNLIGYFYSDCPTWNHTFERNRWRGPIFDPERLKSEAGRKELTALAHHYYKTTHDAIRRYDGHHLILGDRYEANRPLAMEVVNAALPYVDILSFQDFQQPVDHLKEWHEKTGRPVLMADGAARTKQAPDGFRHHDGARYADTLEALFENPGCIGHHLCGAYQRNKARRSGLLDEHEHPDPTCVPEIKAANERILKRVAKLHGM